MSYQFTLWIAGANGRLGTALCRSYENNPDYKLIKSDKDVPVENLDEILRFANLNRPDVIINCAGLTDDQACEENPDDAYRINALGARNLAIAGRRIDAKMIQISTDDVFGGMGNVALNEFDNPTPTTMYGKSKLAGEKLVESLTDKHVIVRSSWIYGLGTHDFVDYVLDKAAKKEPIRLPLDEFSTPTSASALAGFIESIMSSSEYGIFHAACEGGCSRADFAREVLRATGNSEIPVVTSEKVANKKPRFTLLDNMMMRITGIYQMPNWRDELKAYIEEKRYER